MKRLINLIELRQMCQQLRLTYKIDSNDIYISSIVENWLLKPVYEGDKVRHYELWHKNRDYKIHKYHFQKNCMTLQSAIKYIHSHKFKYTSKKQDRLMDLFDIIATNKMPSLALR